jgi:drug/metabolite transporter (DMT)-like permease
VTTRGGLLFGGMVLVWGVPYMFIKVAVDEGLSPAFVAWARVAIAAVLLLPLAWRAGALRGLTGRWRALAAFAVVEIVVPFPLIGAGEQRVSSSLTAVLIATVPLIVALLARWLDPAERAGGSRLVGLLVGLAGVVLLLGVDVAGRLDELVGAAMVLLAAVGYAVGPMIVKRRLADLHPLGPVAAALTISAALLTPPALLTAPAGPPSATALGAVLVLGVLCSAVAFLLFFALIAEVGPGRASVITYVHPVVALLLGVGVLAERVGPGTVAGLLLILVGSWLSTRRRAATAAV